ncbi:MAG: PASTA domain-containing protein [Candidatus Eisenbacteria bacterium]|nr:PASTA domain-containing protein [Candidatus Eisenbacteria bacterium]
MSERPPREEPHAGSGGGPPPFVERRRGHPLRETLLVSAAALLAFAVGLGIFNRVLMPRLIHSGGEVRVPDLQNLSMDQAEQALKASGLQLSRAGERFDPSVPRGFILAQDPDPDTPVRRNRRVLVTTSLGEEFSSVPELFGESRRGAQLLIDRAGLRVGGVTRAPSEDVGQDLVAGSDPPAETVLPRGTAISLLVSTGPGPEVYVMPDLVGREISGVRRQLEGLGFRVLVPPAAASVGPIVSQSPPAGSRVTTDTQIVLQATGRLIR